MTPLRRLWEWSKPPGRPTDAWGDAFFALLVLGCPVATLAFLLAFLSACWDGDFHRIITNGVILIPSTMTTATVLYTRLWMGRQLRSLEESRRTLNEFMKRHRGES